MKRNCILLGVLCLIQAFTAVCSQDPCVDHVIIDEWWRSIGYNNDDNDHVDICDHDITSAWYRANSSAGGDMPTSPPGLNRCGTVYPIWLDGDLPSDEGSIVWRYACVSGILSDCDTQLDVFIKNCGTFNVYNLLPTDACPQAYCFGTEKKCSPGFTSPNGFTPGCVQEPPVLTENPTLSNGLMPLPPGPAVGDQNIFECNIETPGIDDEIWFDVTFLIAGEQVLKLENIHETDLPAILTERDIAIAQDGEFHPNLGYGSNLTCRVQGKWSETEDPGLGVEVSKHYGFEILTEMPIRLEEGDEVEILIRSRLPVNCINLDPGCYIAIELYVPRYHEDFQRCEVDDQHTHLIMGRTGCRMQLTAENWEEGAGITVKAQTEIMADKGTRSFVARFYSDKQSNLVTLSNLALPPVHISVVDKADATTGMQCGAVGNSHMTRYDGFKWENHQPEEYIMFVNMLNDAEVHIHLEVNPQEMRTYICAVFVRAGKSWYIMDTCDGRHVNEGCSGERQPPRDKIYNCYEGRSDMVVHNIGKQYTFTFPTKTEVVVDFERYQGYHDVYITPSVEDFANAYGLCGFIHESGKAQFRMRDGSVTTDSALFAADWKVDPGFWPPSNGFSTPMPIYYCGCAIEDNKVICEATREHAACVDRIVNDKEFNMCYNDSKRHENKASGKSVVSLGIVNDDDDDMLDSEGEDIIRQIFNDKDLCYKDSKRHENKASGKSAVSFDNDDEDMLHSEGEDIIRQAPICRISGQCYDDQELHPSQSCASCHTDNDITDWTIQEGTCFISNTCYSLNEENPANACDVCDPHNNPQDWTRLTGCEAAFKPPLVGDPFDAAAAGRVMIHGGMLVIVSMLIMTAQLFLYRC